MVKKDQRIWIVVKDKKRRLMTNVISELELSNKITNQQSVSPQRSFSPP